MIKSNILTAPVDKIYMGMIPTSLPTFRIFTIPMITNGSIM